MLWGPIVSRSSVLYKASVNLCSDFGFLTDCETWAVQYAHHMTVLMIQHFGHEQTWAVLCAHHMTVLMIQHFGHEQTWAVLCAHHMAVCLWFSTLAMNRLEQFCVPTTWLCACDSALWPWTDLSSSVCPPHGCVLVIQHFGHEQTWAVLCAHHMAVCLWFSTLAMNRLEQFCVPTTWLCACDSALWPWTDLSSYRFVLRWPYVVDRTLKYKKN